MNSGAIGESGGVIVADGENESAARGDAGILGRGPGDFESFISGGFELGHGSSALNRRDGMDRDRGLSMDVTRYNEREESTLLRDDVDGLEGIDSESPLNGRSRTRGSSMKWGAEPNTRSSFFVLRRSRDRSRDERLFVVGGGGGKTIFVVANIASGDR